MSWGVFTQGKAGTDIEAKLAALTPQGDAFKERDDQVKAAKDAATAIITSGAVGDGEGFYVSLTGHANTDHKPDPKWANDTVGVSVSQVTAATVDAWDQAQAVNQQGLR